MATSTQAMPGFIKKQYEFAAHIRNPEKAPCPEDVEDRRMAVYRELFFNNVEGFLRNNFPVLHTILPEDHWQKMARDFFARHKSQTPLFAEIAQEFIQYLQNEREPHDMDPPFMLELAHYEWMELVVDISDADLHGEAIDPNGDLLEGRPAFSPVAVNLSYQFPVHRISPEYQPQEPDDEATHLVVYRDRHDEVHFLEINTITQTLIQTLKENPLQTGLDAVRGIALALQHPEPETVIEAGKQLLYDLRHRDIIAGTYA